MGIKLKMFMCFFFFQAEDGIRDLTVTGVQTCALPILSITSSGARGGDAGGVRRAPRPRPRRDPRVDEHHQSEVVPRARGTASGGGAAVRRRAGVRTARGAGGEETVDRGGGDRASAQALPSAAPP